MPYWKKRASDTSPLEALSQDSTHELGQVRRHHVRRLLDNDGGGGGNDTDANQTITTDANETITGTNSRKAAALARLAIESRDPYGTCVIS
jgi:hypothetical protein